MPARLRLRHQDDVRSKIQASMLVNRLTDHANGKIELTTTQVQAIKILLDKSVSNAPAESIISGDPDNPVVVHGSLDLGQRVIDMLERIRGPE